MPMSDDVIRLTDAEAEDGRFSRSGPKFMGGEGYHGSRETEGGGQHFFVAGGG